jgi:uncharacterized protein (DUF934 family)
MHKVIRRGEVQDDRWHIVWPPLTGDAPPPIPASGAVLVPLGLWLQARESLADRPETGVWLDSHESPEALAPDLDRIPVVGIHFPASGDGRGYSIARQLRTRHRFSGELRAFGDLGRDHFEPLVRCGFDALQPPDDRFTLAQLAAAAEAIRAWG